MQFVLVFFALFPHQLQTLLVHGGHRWRWWWRNLLSSWTLQHHSSFA